MGYSLDEIGYPCPIDFIMHDDLMMLQSFIDQKNHKESEKMRRGKK